MSSDMSSLKMLQKCKKNISDFSLFFYKNTDVIKYYIDHLHCSQKCV